MKISTEIGRMNRRITFLKSEADSDEIGFQTEQMSGFYTCWASVISETGREYWKSREQHEENTFSFKVRFCLKLAEIDKINYFIKYKDKIFNITDINNLQETDSILIIKAVERT